MVSTKRKKAVWITDFVEKNKCNNLNLHIKFCINIPLSISYGVKSTVDIISKKKIGDISRGTSDSKYFQ